MKRTILLAIGSIVVFLLMGSQGDSPVFRASTTGPDFHRIEFQVGPAWTGTPVIVREVTAYNVGLREQTGDEPCIGAAGVDLCRLLAKGWKVCAANFVPMGTILRIRGTGECIVLDRMNRRFAHRVDIAMGEDEVGRAREFGLQKRVVE